MTMMCLLQQSQQAELSWKPILCFQVLQTVCSKVLPTLCFQVLQLNRLKGLRWMKSFSALVFFSVSQPQVVQLYSLKIEFEIDGSRASLTVRFLFLRYEVKKGLRAVYKMVKKVVF